MPNDSKVKIEKGDAGYVAVITFRGQGEHLKTPKKREKLRYG